MKWLFRLAFFCFTLCFLSCGIFKKESNSTKDINSNLLTTIGDREITVNDFIKRCEYVPRPNFCKNNNYIHKKIALNSLIAEKLLAIEFDKTNIEFTPAQNNLITGRKEQSMRQMMLKINGFDKVKPNSTQVRVIAKQMKKTYDISFIILDAVQKQEVVSNNLKSLNTVKDNMGDLPSINFKKITFSENMPMAVKEILYFSEPKKNLLYGPIPINKKNFMFFEVIGWNTSVSVTDEQKKQAIVDAKKSYNELNALRIYENFVSNLMRGKKLEFNPVSFQLFSNKVSKIYLIEKDKKETAIQNSIWDQEVKNTKDVFSFDDLEDIRNQDLLSFDNENYTVDDVLDLIQTHPLVFRNRKVSDSSFDNELKYALADLFRDKEITEKAYKLGYHKNKDIINVEKKWADFISSKIMKNKLIKGSSSTRKGFNMMTSKIDSLQKHYSSIVKIDTDKFERIKLTNIDLNVIYTNQAYSLFEPSFPILTDDHLLDYGEKFNFN